VAADPTDAVVLDRLDLAPLRASAARVQPEERRGPTIFVQIPPASRPHGGASPILNERRLATLREIRGTLSERLRDADGSGQSSELLNIFLAEGEEIFDFGSDPDGIVLGSAEMLADQPEFASNARMRGPQSRGRRDMLREAQGAPARLDHRSARHDDSGSPTSRW
jgi:hypothetical protein